MTNRQKRKGDRCELGVQALIRDLLGWPARRKLGAGRLDDIGDIDGDLMRELVVWYANDPVKCDDFCLKMGGWSLLIAVRAAAEEQAACPICGRR